MKTHLELPPLTATQLEIINGSLLGDASLWYNGQPNCNWALTKSQSQLDILGINKEDYMQWHIDNLRPYSNKNLGCRVSYCKIIHKSLHKLINVRTSKPQSASYIFTTHRHPIFTQMATKWYARDISGNYIIRNKRKIKIIPNDLKLTPLILCVWHMDDGYANRIDGNITLNTQGFTWEECEFLAERLKVDLNITSKVRAKDGKQIIYVPLKSYFDFINLIRPHVQWKCFQHKIDTDTYQKKPQIGETHSQAKFTTEQIKEILVLHKEGWTQKDIACRFGSTKSGISLILSGKLWSHITGIVYKTKRPRVKKEIRKQIINILKKGKSQKVVAQQFGVNQATVSRITKEGNKCLI